MGRNGRNPKSPAYQWYPADAAIDDTYRLLDDAERGNFHTLYDFAWMNDGIPADIESIAVLLGRPLALVKRRWVRLSRCWTSHPTVPDRLVNKRQERERASQEENRKRRKAAADAANGVRWRKSDPNRTPIGLRSDSENVAPLSTTPIHTPVVIPPTPRKRGARAPFVPVWPAHLDTPTVLAAWAEWERYRVEKGHRPYTSTGFARIVNRYTSPQAFVRDVHYSIESNWQGIHAAKGAPSQPPTTPTVTASQIGTFK